MPSIPVIDLHAQYLTIKDEIDSAIHRAIEKSAYIGGVEHDEFEKEFAAYHQARYCAAVANGTDALVLALRVMGVGPGDRVITSPFTFIATVEAITLNGAIPIFADIDSENFNLSAESVESTIQSLSAGERKTLKALLPVHLYGRPADMKGLCDVAGRYGLPVLEDCAQSHGATIAGRRVGTFGIAGTFSFYPSKNLGAYGDAGAVITNDENFYDRVSRIRNHGRAEKYLHAIEGVNSRLDGIQAAVVVPVPDREYGHRPAAFIQTDLENKPDDDTITQMMNTIAGKLKTPVCYYRVNEWSTLPGSQKIDRAWYRMRGEKLLS